MWKVYIGKLEGGKFYTGVTRQKLDRLLAEHQRGKHSVYTSRVLLAEILWSEPHQTLKQARSREQQLKKWTHAKKEALIRGDVAALHRLSRCRTLDP